MCWSGYSVILRILNLQGEKLVHHVYGAFVAGVESEGFEGACSRIEDGFGQIKKR